MSIRAFEPEGPMKTTSAWWWYWGSSEEATALG
jgi:hypothetical protein